jgi:hypothetical protein
VQVSNQHQESVLDYWRCPMIPLRDPTANTGHADSFDDIPADAEPVDDLPWGWRLDALRPTETEPGTVYDVEVRDTVTGAPELARATQPRSHPHRPRGLGLRASPGLRRAHHLHRRGARHPGVA